ncbi:TolC family protein [Pontibacter sp. H259]|uniref:TolC family protein n=1 Tax=Pontibacter sp. H259 TaxID=3133421 RepID=UPI0030BCE83A
MKKSNTLVLAIGLFLAGTDYASAQQASDKDKWTLREAIEQAVKSNIQVQQSKVNKQQADVNLKQSKLDLLPNINGNASHGYNYGTFRDPLTGQFDNGQIRSNNFSLSAGVPLFQGLQLQKQIRQNNYLAEASAADVLVTQNDITLQVLTSYLNILFAKELISTSELQRTSTQKQLDRARILFKAGSVAETNVLELEAQLSSDELTVINAQNQAEISRLNLVQLLNLDDATNFDVIIPEIPDPQANPVVIAPDQVYDVAVQTMPVIKSVDLRVNSAEAGIGIARGAYYPRLSLSGGISSGYSSSRGEFGAEIIPGAFEKQFVGFETENGSNPINVYVPRTTPTFTRTGFSTQLDDNFGQSVGLSLTVPIFNSFIARNNVERSKLNYETAQLNAKQQRNQLRQNIEQAAADAQAAYRKYVASVAQVGSLERSFKNAELRLNSGVINSTDFTVIANNYRRAQSDLIQAKYDYFFKLKVLDFYQGKDISF